LVSLFLTDLLWPGDACYLKRFTRKRTTVADSTGGNILVFVAVVVTIAKYGTMRESLENRQKFEKTHPSEVLKPSSLLKRRAIG